MFPQLIAGPIVRYHEIADQLPDVHRHKMADFGAGFPRFALGLSKKVTVADSVAPIANAVFATSPAGLTTATVWIGILAYTIQIYFDFSGYSDMAIGLASMFGFRFPENFDRPYSAHSITGFWRRWHMSLSRWFRDYVYIPLGGNRTGNAKTYRNLMTVFVLVDQGDPSSESSFVAGPVVNVQGELKDMLGAEYGADAPDRITA